MSEQEYISYFRQEIDAMSGYAPGEQPKDFDKVIKLNTNECPYPPAPGVKKVLEEFEPVKLRLYPDPVSQDLREEFAAMTGYKAENIMTGNGSDDLLTIITRCFTDKEKPLVCFDPSYSLYPTLAKLQGAECIKIALTEDFEIPEDVLDQAKKGNLFFIARPNAPTGNLLCKDKMHHICRNFKGIVVIDEAYADFSEDNCMDFVKTYSNVIVTRTFSKSRSLAGLRFSFAVAHPKIIEGMMKMKDSYNVSMLTQKVALASLLDKEYFADTVRKICQNRSLLADGLKALGFEINPSQANFLFVKPPVCAEKYFNGLKKHNILVRYFPQERTKDHVRITVGSEEEIARLLEVTRLLIAE